MHTLTISWDLPVLNLFTYKDELVPRFKYEREICLYHQRKEKVLVGTLFVGEGEYPPHMSLRKFPTKEESISVFSTRSGLRWRVVVHG